MFAKFLAYLFLSTLLFSLSGCTNSSAKTMSSEIKASYLKVPSSDCEVRKWYNYQVVAIPMIDKRWVEKGISLEVRATRAYSLRHNARMNARYMMKDKEAVKKLEERDTQKYGNPDGPTFLYLVKKMKKKGFNRDESYREIIKSASRTSPTYNGKCVK
ncbi:MAG: Unknown protein [uncultured Sulfurovum sp.]|uniref:Lipoprotein n=1 Tax=uncultured Sulfurovum sp. TaxID=269237 RepID=A0A6S6SS25_9BACT|nr:MAG: Unknown protein [uncultured Sulfurovum sp.]